MSVSASSLRERIFDLLRTSALLTQEQKWEIRDRIVLETDTAFLLRAEQCLSHEREYMLDAVRSLAESDESHTVDHEVLGIIRRAYAEHAQMQEQSLSRADVSDATALIESLSL